MILGLVDQLQIFWQLFLIELLGVLTGLRLLKLQHFIYPRLLTELLLSMLMTLLCILSVIRHLICGNNLNWLPNLNLICKKLWTGISCLLISMLGKLVSFDQSSNTGSIDVKMEGSVLEEKSSFRMLGLTFSSKLDWGSYIITILRTVS